MTHLHRHMQLGIGSGLDINALVKSPPRPTRRPRRRRSPSASGQQAKVSSLGEVSSGLDNFATALNA